MLRNRRQHTTAEGRGRAIQNSGAHELRNVLVDYKRMNTRSARAAYADAWLGICAEYYEETWPIVYEMLKLVEQDEIYKDERRMGGQTYKSFADYFEATIKQPFAIWAELEKTYHYVKDYAPDLLKKAWSEVRNLQHGGAREGAGRPFKDQMELTWKPNNQDNNVILKKQGNSRDYTLARLKRDHPELLERVLGGELSANAAAIEAGFRKKPIKRFKSCPYCGHELP